MRLRDAIVASSEEGVPEEEIADWLVEQSIDAARLSEIDGEYLVREIERAAANVEYREVCRD